MIVEYRFDFVNDFHSLTNGDKNRRAKSFHVLLRFLSRNTLVGNHVQLAADHKDSKHATCVKSAVCKLLLINHLKAHSSSYGLFPNYHALF